jgi:uncharacterized membrane protein YhaH (DUF805 family)
MNWQQKMANKHISVGGALSSAVARTFDFSGRSSRSEYFYFFVFMHLFIFAWSFVVSFIFGSIGQPREQSYIIIGTPVIILLFISLSLSVRRIHDIGMSYWSVLLKIFGLTFASSVMILLSNSTVIFSILDYSYDPLIPVAAGSAAGSISWLFWLTWLWRPGDEGTNRFGPSPLLVEPQPATTSPISAAGVASTPTQSRPSLRPPPVSGPTAPPLPEERPSQAPTAAEDAYDVAGRELQSGAKHAGAWARAMVEADGDPARTEVAYVRLRVAALDAIALEDAARRMEAEAERAALEAEAERNALEAEAERAALEAEAERAELEAEAERKAKENNVSRFEAELTLLARNAIARRGQYDSAKINEVQSLANYIRASYESAEDLARWEIYRSGTGYRFQGKFYAWLTGAVGAAREQADEKATTLGTAKAPSGAAPQGGAAPTASDDQPPFRWNDFR